MHEEGASPKRVEELPGHASGGTTLAIYTLSARVCL
jgi:hypothetical protein